MAVRNDLPNRYKHLALDGLRHEEQNALVTRAYERTYKLYEDVMTKATLSTKDALADAFLYGVIEGRIDRQAVATDAEAIATAARDMRAKQREYFRNRAPVALGLAKTAEAHLDRLLSSPTLPGLRAAASPSTAGCSSESNGEQSTPAGGP